MRLPVTAWTSITHRVSGVILFVSMAILLWLLDVSLGSREGFAQVGELLSAPFAKLVLWGILAALIYHSVAGVRHLIMDFGVGESMQGGVLGARVVIVVSIVLTLLAGVWIW